MAAPPDDLRAWRPDDGDYEETAEMLDQQRTITHLFMPNLTEIILPRPVTGTEALIIMAECLAAKEAGVTVEQWRELPKPRRDMLLQRKRVGRRAR